MPGRIIASHGTRHVSERLGPLTVLLAAPRGFCAGVRRAIAAVEDALEQFGAPVYVRRAIVHNLAVVRDLEEKGAIFVQELDEVPSGAVVILSAHGVARSVATDAEKRGLVYFDAVCPLVAKVHREVERHHRAGRHIILIGHAGHPEIEGTLGQIANDEVTVIASAEDIAGIDVPDGKEVAYATQTTYSVDEARAIIEALRERFPRIMAPASSDICYATTNRQAAVKQMAPIVDAILVAGESFSSNATRLVEVASAFGCRSVQLLADASQIDWEALQGCRSVGVTAAASTPEDTVSAILETLGERFDLAIEEFGDPVESAVFKPLRLDVHAPAL